LFSTNTVPTGTVDQTALGFNQGTLLAYLNSSGLYTNSSVTNITANSTVSVALAANSLTLTTALAAVYGGTGQNTYSSGDLLVANTGNVLSKLTLSTTAGYILQSNGTALVYDSLDGGTF
jgi:phage baseplate assembly protein gpV